MSEIKEWLSITKQEKSELSDFIALLESYFSDAGFNASEFEKAVDADLKSLEDQVIKELEDDEHVQN